MGVKYLYELRKENGVINEDPAASEISCLIDVRHNVDISVSSDNIAIINHKNLYLWKGWSKKDEEEKLKRLSSKIKSLKSKLANIKRKLHKIQSVTTIAVQTYTYNLPVSTRQAL